METDDCSFGYIFNLLTNYIKENYSVESHSEEFSSLKQNYEKVQMAHTLLAEAKLLPENEVIHPKSSEESKFFREKGNKEFLHKEDLLAIQSFSASAAFAPLNSEELALAYANRSAATFSLKEYTVCIEDIDRALSGTYPEHLKYKVFERKGKCLEFLGMNKSAKEAFQLALKTLSSSHLEEERVNTISSSLTKQINNCSGSDKSHKIKKKCLPCLSAGKNDKILSASSLVCIEYSQEVGRHLVATADIQPGDVLVIEEPYAAVLMPESYNNYCYHCKKRCHSLIPCLYCVIAMYCNEVCRSNSWNENHRVECTLIPLLLPLNFNKIELLAVRTLLMATKQNKSLKELIEMIPQIESITDPKTKGFDDKGYYDSGNYRSVHNLVGNMEHRSNADVFRRATTAAYILHLLDKYTDYFSSVDGYVVPEKTSYINHFDDVQSFNSIKFFVGGLLLSYLMICPSNAHEISEMVLKKVGEEVDCESVEIGGALYPVLSLINHSCDPNVVRHSYNGDLNILTAIQIIPAGEQIFDNYGYHHAMHSVRTRQKCLLSQYYFSCQCRACKENWPVYSELPNSKPVFLNPSLKYEVEKSSKIFQDVLSEIKSGDMDKKLGFLYAHLSLLHHAIRRPWKEYSECQEAIKQCISQQSNQYLAY